MYMHYTIPKWVFLVLAPYLYVAYLHGTKAFLVDNLLSVFCKGLLEISRCLETKESVWFALPLLLNEIVPQVLTSVFRHLAKVCKEFCFPILKRLQSEV